MRLVLDALSTAVDERISVTNRQAALSLLAAATLLLSACSSTAPVEPAPIDPAPSTEASPTPTTTPTTPFALGEPTTIIDGLDAPWSIAFLGETALISERDTGAVREVVGDGTRVVGTIDDVVHGGEGGLLGLAVDDDGRLYAYSTGSSGNRVQRFTMTGGPGSLRLGAAETIIDGIPSARTHNGGRIAFGPDGMLYVTTGDAGDRDAAQDPGSLAGKILRMTPDGEAPADNPTGGSLVYSLGHRNPQGIGWTTDTTMIASEFGQNTWDELNVITPGGNYGWPDVEGTGGGDRLIDPVQQWRTDAASPSGLAITQGVVVIANLRGERVRSVPVDDLGTATELFGGEYGRLRDVTVAPDGSLWMLTNNTDGRGSPRGGDDRVLRVAVDS